MVLEVSMKAVQLNGFWNVQNLSDFNPPGFCTLPGYIHSEPIPSGAGDWVTYLLESGWELSRTFQINDCTSYRDALLLLSKVHGEVDLFLNGYLIGGVAHTLREYRFPAGSFLVNGENHLSIIFHRVSDDAEYRPGIFGNIYLAKPGGVEQPLTGSDIHVPQHTEDQTPFTLTVELPDLQPDYSPVMGRTSGSISVPGLVADPLVM